MAVQKEFKFVKTSGLKFKFGAHVAASGGVSNSVLNARNIGANSFALFLKSPRKWESPEITDKEASEFKRLCDLYGYDPKTDILPHGSYFINLANPDKEKEEKAYGGFLDDLLRCEKLGIGLYNFHPGSSLQSDHKEAIKRLAKNINKAIKETTSVKIVLENMSGQGNLIGSNLQDLRDVIDLIEDKKRVGVCIDTCHTFASGYDISTQDKLEKFFEDFDEIVGREYLSSIHLNDSKSTLDSNRDLHEKLGQGFLKLECFRAIANSPRFENIPIILETPAGKDDSLWGDEIKLLEWMIGRSKDDDEVLQKSEILQKEGESERKKFLAQLEKKTSKRKPKADSTIDSLVKKKTKVK